MNKKTKYVVVWIFFTITIVLSLLSPITIPYIVPHASKAAEKLAPDNVELFAKGYIADIKNGNTENILKNTSVETGLTAENLDIEKLSQNYTNLKLETAKVIGFSINSKSSALYTLATTTKKTGTEYTIVYQLENDDSAKKYLGVEMAIAEVDGQLQLSAVDSKFMNEPLEKSPILPNYDLKLFVRVLFSLIIVVTALLYLKASPKPRWWVLLIILIITLTFSLNSTEPNGIRLSLPLGVIIYWVARKKILAAEVTQTPVV